MVKAELRICGSQALDHKGPLSYRPGEVGSPYPGGPGLDGGGIGLGVRGC